MRARLPPTTQLHEKRVGLVGLGALGAPLATELLRAQVGVLHVLDAERVEAGNTVRWPLGLSAIGNEKAAVIAAWGASEYPFTEIRPWSYRIGAVRPPAAGPLAGQSYARVLTAFLDNLDLLIDASAELGLQHLLSTLAQQAGLPQIYAWGTEGGWGGAVARVLPGQTGCWHCLQLAFEDGTIPLPPAGPTDEVQPRGCAAPTFAAASHALSPIVAQATRVAARLLHSDATPGDVFICALEGDHGELPAPQWESYDLNAHVRCPAVHLAPAA